MLYLEKNIRVFLSPKEAANEYYKAYAEIQEECENHKQKWQF